MASSQAPMARVVDAPATSVNEIDDHDSEWEYEYSTTETEVRLEF